MNYIWRVSLPLFLDPGVMLSFCQFILILPFSLTCMSLFLFRCCPCFENCDVTSSFISRKIYFQQSMFFVYFWFKNKMTIAMKNTIWSIGFMDSSNWKEVSLLTQLLGIKLNFSHFGFYFTRGRVAYWFSEKMCFVLIDFPDFDGFFLLFPLFWIFYDS